MVTQPSYLKALKEYARVQFGGDDKTEQVIADFSNESDRGAVILAATGIEDFLEVQLMGMMLPLQNDTNARSSMFGANGVCGTFSQKILLSYSLGIICDRTLRRRIDLVREIRNVCAHSRLPISFDVPEFQEAAKAAIGDESLSMIKDHEPSTLRIAFIIATSTIQQSILYRRNVSASESYDLAIRMLKDIEAGRAP